MVLSMTEHDLVLLIQCLYDFALLLHGQGRMADGKRAVNIYNWLGPHGADIFPHWRLTHY